MKTFSQFLLEATDPKGPIKKYMSPEEIAKKHKIPLDTLEPELKKGIKIESEHTGDKRMARIIALQHLEELPNYYSKLKKMEKVNESKSGDSSLRDWFTKSSASDGTPGWVQLGGKYAGKPCAKQPGQTTKPKCGSSKMKAALSDDEEKKAFERKNRQDPNPDREGKAKMVATEEKDACYSKVKSRYKVWPSAYASGALVKCRKVGAKNWGNKTKKESYELSNWRDEFIPTEYEFTDIILPDQIKSTTKSWIMENLTNIKSRGATYLVSLIWRGQNISMQIFFPQTKRPTKNEVTDEIRKIYPLANVLTFSPIKMDPTKALLYAGDENGPQ